VRSDKGEGVIWVVASNFDDASTRMDEAMLRRFSVKINFRLPNKANGASCCTRSWRARPMAVSTGRAATRPRGRDHGQPEPGRAADVVERASMLAIQENKIINTELMFRALNAPPSA
jgi:cell division protease FtsH